MESDRFDTLIRRLTEGHSRRGALTGLAGVTLSLFGITASDGKHKKRKKKHRRASPPSPPAAPLSPPAPTCSDGIKNGNETDLDCGGSCPPCANFKTCSSASDCRSGRCAPDGTCQECASDGECHADGHSTCFCSPDGICFDVVAATGGVADCPSCPAGTVYCTGDPIHGGYACAPRCGAA